MEVAGGLAVGVGHDVAGEAVLGDGALDVRGGGRRREGHDRVRAQGDVADLLLGELERRAERAGPIGEDALARRAVHDRGHLVEREGARGLVLRLHAEQAEDGVGARVEGHDDRAHRAADRHERRREEERRPVRHRERDVLRHHLAEHDVEEGDHHQRHDEGDGADDLLRPAGRAERDLQEVVDRRLGDVQDEQRAHGDAELRRREHEGRVLHREERRPRAALAALGERLDLRAARGDDGELGADEEGVHEEEHHQPREAGPVTHGRAPLGRRSGRRTAPSSGSPRPRRRRRRPRLPAAPGPACTGSGRRAARRAARPGGSRRR